MPEMRLEDDDIQMDGFKLLHASSEYPGDLLTAMNVKPKPEKHDSEK